MSPEEERVQTLEANASILRNEVERVIKRLSEGEQDIEVLRQRIADLVANHEASARKLWSALANLQMVQSEQHKILQSILDTLETAAP